MQSAGKRACGTVTSHPFRRRPDGAREIINREPTGFTPGPYSRGTASYGQKQKKAPKPCSSGFREHAVCLVAERCDGYRSEAVTPESIAGKSDYPCCIPPKVWPFEISENAREFRGRRSPLIFARDERRSCEWVRKRLGRLGRLFRYASGAALLFRAWLQLARKVPMAAATSACDALSDESPRYFWMTESV